MKKALITGITGQDGSYLSEILLGKGYEVHGVIRRSSLPNTGRIDHIFDPESRSFLHYGDLTEGIDDIIYKVQPDEIYNLAAMSQVRISFDIPVYTLEANTIGVCKILEAIRHGRDRGILKNDIKFYHASSSELWGTTPPPQSETSLMCPSSPYGIAKLASYFLVKRYREGYGMFAAQGILHNHESPRRGVNFVTRKITRIAARIAHGLSKEIELGNLDAKRDWGFSRDYMNAVYMIMQAPQAEEWVVSTGEAYSVREFAEKVFNYFNLDFYKYLKYNEVLTRPVEVPYLLGDSTKIRTKLGWKPEYSFDDLVKSMCDNDYNEVLKEIKSK